MSDDDTRELKRILLNHYTNLLENELSNVVAQKGYSQRDFDDLLNKDS
jgi:hypothetical protein